MVFSPVWLEHRRLRLTIPPIAFIVIFSASTIAERYGLVIGHCIAQKALGVRCPGCGVTTSVAALMRGNWTASIAANAAGPVVCAYFATLVACFIFAVSGDRNPHRIHRWQLLSDRVLFSSLFAAWLWHSVIR